MLTTREIQIVTKLLEAEKTLRTKDLSNYLDVSTRTIKNDLKNVRVWFQQYDIELCAQPNKGYWIDTEENERLMLYQTLLGEDSKPFHADQNTRIEKILYIFFSQRDYITAAQLSNYLQVSRNTILSDLNFLEQYIQPWEIKLKRKTRVGYKLVGPELNIRLLFENIIQRNLNNFDVYNIITQIQSDKRVEWNHGFTSEINVKFAEVIIHFRKIWKDDRRNDITHSEILSTLIRLTIFLVRMEYGFTIGNYRLLKLDQNKSHDLAGFLTKIVGAICEENALPLLEDEFSYIHRNFLLEDENIDLLILTGELIHYVSEKEQAPYSNDTRLFNNLLLHLSLRFEKHSTYVTEINPFINEIKQKNASLFFSVKEGFKNIFSDVVNHMNFPEAVEDSFISFITLHFLNSYENVLNRKPEIRALYVCSTGRGVARFIKNRVESQINDIKITTYCSVMEIANVTKNENFDLIISMFPIKTTFPVIVVDPVPTEDNIEAIREKVHSLYQQDRVDAKVIEKDVYNPNEKDFESTSQEIIIKGFEISYEIYEKLTDKVIEEREKGLFVHLFLMIHRYYFHKQYDQFIYQRNGDQNEDLLREINEILKSHSIYINESEQSALLQYFKK
ncbi:BglG family transcription antiterminator [Oceanobacillus manasiensis]|uniref:BglG family transcription antiterminator n=1 Tax=Oceanobacillus manasiensis TaxID=586413 RepID=UPI0005A6B665|nr:HTH domain-containing protein [Oceanobacillus manasiensis]